MSESMSSPWIRDYLTDVAETHGSRLYNAPELKQKKRVQLTDFLTYQQDSYVWAWISDKEYRVSVRISKDAVDQYKSKNRRNIVDCRFFLVFISGYRPMFSPRPLGPNAPGNTPVSHISLEINHVSSIGTGAHTFGNPRDLESDKNMKEWVLGLRQDGGGGNVLMLRKQQKLVQNQKTPPSPPPPPPPCPPCPISQSVALDVVQPKPERPHDFKRAYAKRWRTIDVDQLRLASKPEMERHISPTQHLAPNPTVVSAESPCRTPPLQPQGTPTNWSPSNRGSPVTLNDANTSLFGDEIQQHDDPEDLHITTLEHTTVDDMIFSNTSSLQPPTPAQRVKRSPPPCSSPPPRSSQRPYTCSSSHPMFPCSSPLFPSSSLPLSSSFFPVSVGTRKSFKRKIPHPGLPIPRADFTNQGPAQILVPNSDTSGTGSSQSYSQSQLISEQQQQQQQPQSPSHSPALRSFLAGEFKTTNSSTPREEKLGNTSEALVESLPMHGDIDEQEAVSTDDESTRTTGSTRTATVPPATEPSMPRLAGLSVDFERIDFGKGARIPRLNLNSDIKRMLLTTGRIRTDQKVEEDGSIYIDL